MLQGSFVIESWQSSSGELVVRLMPGHWDAGHNDPVVTIHVAQLQNPTESEAGLLHRKDEFIVALDVSEDCAIIHAECDIEPLCLRGGSVSVTRGPYSANDVSAILEDCHEQLRKYRSAIADAESFIAELIRRAEIKRDLSSRDGTALELEVDVLRRVLHKLRER
jgi:hypothetical protein